MRNTKTQTLNTFEAGGQGTVIAIKGDKEFRKRLISLGLHVGDEVRVLHQGEETAPMLIVVGGTRLALGQDMAKRILLIPLSDEKPSWGSLKARLKRYVHGGHDEKVFGRFRRGQHGKNYRIRERELGVS